MNLYFMGKYRLYELDGRGSIEQYAKEGNIMGGQDNSLIGNPLQNGYGGTITTTGYPTTENITYTPDNVKYFDGLGNEILPMIFPTKEPERMPIKEERDPTAPVRRIMLED